MTIARSLVASMLVLVSASGCASEWDSEEVGDIDLEDADAEDFVIWDPPPGGTVFDPGGPPPETATSITFYANNNFTGAAVTQQFTATSGGPELMGFVRWSQLSAAMPSGARSVRMTCGTRKSRVLLYQAANTSTSFSSWSNTSSPEQLECEAGQQVSAVFPTSFGPTVARSAAVVLHPYSGYRYDVSFTSFFGPSWEEALDEQLPDGASRNGAPVMTMLTSRTFRLRQNLKLNHWACFERSGFFTLDVRLNGPGDVSVSVVDSYVDQAEWPEPWDCWTNMKNKLSAGASDAADTLEAELPLQLTQFAFGDCMSIQYFVPITPRNFDIVSAGVEYFMSECDPNQ
ncbi:MAG: hypothetical protein HOW73_49425 [Polyangiaceae bacterium]|nr:hypothetical protein [Polyangiaceae bacterium]